jgi:hypothetical protein
MGVGEPPSIEPPPVPEPPVPEPPVPEPPVPPPKLLVPPFARPPQPRPGTTASADNPRANARRLFMVKVDDGSKKRTDARNPGIGATMRQAVPLTSGVSGASGNGSGGGGRPARTRALPSLR